MRGAEGIVAKVSGQRPAAEPAPWLVRVLGGAALAAVFVSALYLFAVRGPALLIDLAHFGARLLCL